ncbi:hypothetical protein [Kribbella sp. NPDC048928]|uniref:hypothetical protein n=1 Tax=Kribbella sp. NPDC048928 TaxID=3364111 RepID=UPI00370FC4D8
MPPLLIVLTGLPYSGKTTLARALEQQGAAVVELDHINRERGFRIEDGVHPLLDTRRATAAATPDRHVLSPDVLHRVQRRFQPPTTSTHTISANWPTNQQLQAATTNWPTPASE